MAEENKTKEDKKVAKKEEEKKQKKLPVEKGQEDFKLHARHDAAQEK